MSCCTRMPRSSAASATLQTQRPPRSKQRQRPHEPPQQQLRHHCAAAGTRGHHMGAGTCSARAARWHALPVARSCLLLALLAVQLPRSIQGQQQDAPPYPPPYGQGSIPPLPASDGGVPPPPYPPSPPPYPYPYPTCPYYPAGTFSYGSCNFTFDSRYQLGYMYNTTSHLYCAAMAGSTPSTGQCKALVPQNPSAMIATISWYSCVVCSPQQLVGVKVLFTDGTEASAGLTTVLGGGGYAVTNKGSGSISLLYVAPVPYMANNSASNSNLYVTYSSYSWGLYTYVSVPVNSTKYYSQSWVFTYGSSNLAGLLVSASSETLYGMGFLFQPSNYTAPPLPPAPPSPPPSPPWFYPSPSYGSSGGLPSAALIGIILAAIFLTVFICLVRHYAWRRPLQTAESLGQQRAQSALDAAQVVYPEGRPRRRAGPPLATIPSATAYVNNNTVYFPDSPAVTTPGNGAPSPLYSRPAGAAAAGALANGAQGAEMELITVHHAEPPGQGEGGEGTGTLAAASGLSTAAAGATLPQQQQQKGDAASALDDKEAVAATGAEAGAGEAVPKGVCVICLSEPSTVAFLPCGHLCCCETCVTVASQRHKCPVCRGRSTGYTRIFSV